MSPRHSHKRPLAAAKQILLCKIRLGKALIFMIDWTQPARVGFSPIPILC